MLQNILENIKKYQSVIAWILQDSILRFKKKVFLIVISGFLGVALQLQTIALVFYYAKALETGKIINILDYNINIRDSKLILIALGIIILISLIIAAWLNYYSRNRLLKLWRIYEEFCAKRVFHILAEKRLRLSFFYQEIIDDDTRLLKIVRTDSRYCGRVLEIVLSIFTPSVTAVISSGALIYINPLLTVLLILPLTITIFFWYRASRKASNNASLLEQYSSNSSTEYRSLIRWFKQDVYSLPTSYIENLYNHLENSRGFLDAFEGRLNSLAKSDLASNIFLAITIFIILMVLGWNIISQQAGWGELIVYVFALRYSLFNLRQVTQKITAINLFYPHIKRYFHFLKTSTSYSLVEKEQKVASIPLQYQLKHSSIIPKYSSWDGILEAGSTVALITPAKLNQYRIFTLMSTLLDHNEHLIRECSLSAYFATSKNDHIPGVPLNLLLSIPQIVTRSRLYEKLQGSGIEDKLLEELPYDLNISITKEAWTNISPQTKLAVKYLNYTFYFWFLVEESDFNQLPKATQSWFLENHKGIIILAVNPQRITNIGNYQEQYVVYLQDNEVILLDTVEQFSSYKNKLKGENFQDQKATIKNYSENQKQNYDYDVNHDFDMFD